jgi:hypothetical protein
LRAHARRRTTAVVFAVAVHLLLGIALLRGRADLALAPDVAMQVSLVPSPRKKPPVQSQPTAARPPAVTQHRTPQPALTSDVPAIPALPPAPAASEPPAPAEDPSARNLQRALKGRLGCANPRLVQLTEAERNSCDERLGNDTANARAYPVISPKLKKLFDGTFECKPDDDWCLYRVGKGPYPGLAGMLRKKKKTDWD